MILLEFDLSGAEWVVVAYIANDPNMIGVVTSGKSPHVVTGSLISGVPEELVSAENKIVGNQTDQITIEDLRKQHLKQLFDIPGAFLPRTMSIRQAGKKSNHGLNYGMKYRRFALTNEIPEKDAMIMCDAYSEIAYPGIKDYWSGTIQELRNNRTLYNCFGRKVKLRGEWGNDLFMEAFSFKPQSTVVDIVNQAMCLVYENEESLFIPVELGAQVHDSLMLQYPIPTVGREWEEIAQFCLRVREYMRPELEYSGHKFRLRSDLKVGLSWGDMREVRMTEDASALAEAIRTAFSDVSQTPQPQYVEMEEFEVVEEASDSEEHARLLA